MSMKFFSPDSPVYRFMQRLTDIVILNLLWLLFSLPVVTLGCSTAAAFSVTLKFVDDTEGHVWNDFIKGFRDNFRQGIPLSFISIIAPTAVYLDFKLASDAENAVPFLIIGFLSAYVLIFSLLYVYPLITRYENTVINSLKNSFRLGMKFFGRTVLLIFIAALELVIIFWDYNTLFVGALIGPSCIMYTISGTATYIFKEMEKEPT